MVSDRAMVVEDEAERDREACAIVGELVLVSNILDFRLNQVVIEVLDLGSSSMLMPVVATLDPSRKIEMLKGRASHMPAGSWKTKLMTFVDSVERVLKQRNIACHTLPTLDAGQWSLKPLAAAKMFKSLNLGDKTLKHTSPDDFRRAIQVGKQASEHAEELLVNWKRANAERLRRAASRGDKNQA
jgi:hypothetical protein